LTILEPQLGDIPIPRPTPLSEPFWQGCAEHRLLFQRCTACGAPIFNPSPICRVCTSLELRWEQSRGEGNIYSWTVAWRPQHPSFVVPYAPIIVDLQEGYQMLSILVGCEIKELRVGLPVAVAFYDVGIQGDGGSRTLPYFELRR
jgi:uncharacterized OB-fold protein